MLNAVSAYEVPVQAQANPRANNNQVFQTAIVQDSEQKLSPKKTDTKLFDVSKGLDQNGAAGRQNAQNGKAAGRGQFVDILA